MKGLSMHCVQITLQQHSIINNASLVHVQTKPRHVIRHGQTPCVNKGASYMIKATDMIKRPEQLSLGTSLKTNRSDF